MGANIHLHVHVSSLEKSREFYRRFLGAEPVKDRPDYVKFLPAWAPVNLALSPGHASAEGRVNHVGIQVDSPGAVLEHLVRVKAAGLMVREEMGVDCCHANQDKFWVEDPDGVEWEVYHLNYDLGPAPRATGLTIASEPGCCGR
jgi:catechol 2,3-dioxygenase-like lactoylglutathione lyase family enzyme